MNRPTRFLAFTALLVCLSATAAFAQDTVPKPRAGPAHDSVPRLPAAPGPAVVRPPPVVLTPPAAVKGAAPVKPLAGVQPRTPAKPAAPASAPPDLWDVAVDLSVAGANGNESYLLFSSGFKIQRKHTAAKAMQVEGLVRYGTHSGQTIARQYRGGVRYEGSTRALLSPLVFVTAERDLFRKLELRAQGGVGGTYTPLRAPAGMLSMSLAVLYDHEDIIGVAAIRTARLNGQLKAARQLGSGVKLENVSSYQPLWRQPGDYLAASVTTLTSRVTQHVALTVAYDFERNSTPPAEVLPDDQTLNVGLKLTF